MARLARVVIPGAWHHVTQRGNSQRLVFFSDDERAFYLALLRRYTARHGVRLTGYCLMSNHVHLVAVPADEHGLALALGRAHNEYARWLNLRHENTGHLWQNRYYSCMLDQPHAWEALRYVELNPVRAGLTSRPEEWPWSSARAHLAGKDESGLLDMSDWNARWNPTSWGEALTLGLGDAALAERIREATRTGRPAVDEAALDEIETQIGRRLRPRKRGPKVKAAGSGQMYLGIA